MAKRRRKTGSGDSTPPAMPMKGMQQSMPMAGKQHMSVQQMRRIMSKGR